MDAEHDEALLRSADADADADTDGGSPSIEAEEQAHLDEVLGAVRAAVDRARGLAERTEASHREAGAQLAASRGELAPEEAHLSAYELNRMDAQAALAHRSRGRLEKLLDSPYFARVDFVEGEEGASSSAGSAEGETAAARQITYLGRFALTWENQALISDWRSPVAALFYDFEPGPAAFEAPAGRREGTLALKRQISIEEGQLRYAVDSSSSVRDEVLATVLGARLTRRCMISSPPSSASRTPSFAMRRPARLSFRAWPARARLPSRCTGLPTCCIARK